MKIPKEAAFFSLGGAAYVGLELLWRRRSHGSMFFAGGTCFLLLGKLEKLPLSAPARSLLGAGAITAVELAAGLTVNRDYRVWDYRKRRGNFLGQICPEYCALWMPLSLGAMEAYRWLDRGLGK